MDLWPKSTRGDGCDQTSHDGSDGRRRRLPTFRLWGRVVTGLLVILGFFAVIGAAMAFLINYEELSHHFADRRAVVSEAIRTSLMTLAFFGLLIVVVLVVLAHAS
jgi:protein-S-isoprenylcysteine O-methyltransferase Ste14